MKYNVKLNNVALKYIYQYRSSMVIVRKAEHIYAHIGSGMQEYL